MAGSRRCLQYRWSGIDSKLSVLAKFMFYGSPYCSVYEARPNFTTESGSYFRVNSSILTGVSRKRVWKGTVCTEIPSKNIG
jgi:hypothetical protein